jgi:hypothetical protein
MTKQYADVNYMGELYCDALEIGGAWFFEDWVGNAHSFVEQAEVEVLSPLSPRPRHTNSFSGYVHSQFKNARAQFRGEKAA